MEPPPLNNILVIDEVPLIAVGLREMFLRHHGPSTILHSENIYSALSSPTLSGQHFDLIVLDPATDIMGDILRQSIYELKERFSTPRVMIYSKNYIHDLIDQMGPWGIDAYVHKYEDLKELRIALDRLAAGEHYISGILYTLYYEYHMD